MLQNKIILITGGTGSFGHAVAKRLLRDPTLEIRILSRDEKKQDDMRKHFNSDQVKFYLGDVRDRASIDEAMRDVDYVFHAAALKQVPSCEFFPMQAVKTNVEGTHNVIESAIDHGIDKVICLSTDKAVYPINAMGMSKALMEKLAISKSKSQSETSVCITRYGNVLASRGSVVPLFLKQIAESKPLTITSRSMTRFIMSLENAVDLVLFCFEHGESGDLYVQKAPAATILQLANATIKYSGKTDDYPIFDIGYRHGEKQHEVLLSKEEMLVADDLGDYFRVRADKRTLNYEKYFAEGVPELTTQGQFDSFNAPQLSAGELDQIFNDVL